MLEILESISGVSFFSATQLVREWHIPHRLAGVIRRQPGYNNNHEMTVSKTKSGEWRLYARIDNDWMDASLHDMLDDIGASNAAAALGSIGGKSTSKAKSAAARANGRKGGRPRKNPK